MSAHSKEVARILREQFGRTKSDADWLSCNTSMGITPRTDRDARELHLAEQIALTRLSMPDLTAGEIRGVRADLDKLRPSPPSNG
jgi:hypothetical protein